MQQQNWKKDKPLHTYNTDLHNFCCLMFATDSHEIWDTNLKNDPKTKLPVIACSFFKNMNLGFWKPSDI